MRIISAAPTISAANTRPIVELLINCAPELRHHIPQRVAFAEFGISIDYTGDLVENLEIFADDPADTRTLHLHRDRSVVSEPRPVDLSQRSCGNRLLLELIERGGNAHSQLIGHELLDFFVRKRTDIVVELGKNVDVNAKVVSDSVKGAFL